MGKRIRRKSKKSASGTTQDVAAEGEHASEEHNVAAKPATDAPETAPTPAAPASGLEPSDTPKPAESTKGDGEGEGEGDNDEGPRKRRRTRRRRRNRDVAEVPIGPDPNTLEDLSDGAQRALAYAQLYTKGRETWKFSKPRQNWLIRHVLWSPAIYAAAVRAAEADVPEAGAWVPDDFVPVVSVYLASVQGSALQRIIDGLTETEKAGNEEAQDNNDSQQADGEAPEKPESKEQDGEQKPEQKSDEQSAENAESGQANEPSVLQVRAERASQVLQWINSRLYTDA